AALLPPAKSRLTHGVGIVSMGFVMDKLFLSHGRRKWTSPAVADRLTAIAPRCAWTEGRWLFRNGDSRLWNELQNIDRDIRLLADHCQFYLESEQHTGV